MFISFKWPQLVLEIQKQIIMCTLSLSCLRRELSEVSLWASCRGHCPETRGKGPQSSGPWKPRWIQWEMLGFSCQAEEETHR